MKKALPEIWAMFFCFWLFCCPPFTHPLPPLPGYWAGFLWRCPPLVHPWPTLYHRCLGIGRAFSDDAHLWSTLGPPFIPVAWVLGGLSLTMPIFRPPLAHPLSPLPGYWVGFL